MDFSRKRWISLGAAMLAAMFAGLIYAWSVLVEPLIAANGWSKSEVSLGYTLYFVLSSVGMLVMGRLRPKLGIANFTLLGALFYCGGMVLFSFNSGNLWELYVYWGCVSGVGSGMIYISLAPYVVQIFPDRKGIAAGLYTSFYGMGALIWAPLASYIIRTTGSVNYVFICYGIGFFIAVTIISRFLFEPPAGYDEGTGGAAARQAVAAETSPFEMIRTVKFWMIFFMFVFGSISGMMILSLGSSMLQGALRYTPEKAAIIVGFFAVASTLGRLFWGVASDRIGRSNVLFCLTVITLASMQVLARISAEYIFIAAILAVPMCYGAYAALMGPLAGEAFGARHIAINYNIIMLSFGVSGLLGPQIVSRVIETTGGYSGAFTYGTIFAAVTLVLLVALRIADKKIRI